MFNRKNEIAGIAFEIAAVTGYVFLTLAITILVG